MKKSALSALEDFYNNLYLHGVRDQLLSSTSFSRRTARLGSVQKLCGFIATIVERGNELPPPMRKFLIDFLRDPNRWAQNPGKAGPKGWELTWRNHVIVRAIYAVAASGFPATRHPTRNGGGARRGIDCQRRTLEKGAKVHLSEKAINNIWDSAYGRNLRNRLEVPPAVARRFSSESRAQN